MPMPATPAHLRHDATILGLTGRAGAGKDTVAEYLCSVHGFERYAFAEPIRDMATALLVAAGIDYAHLFERGLKEQPIAGLGPDAAISGRQILQSLGDWGRAQHPDFWVRIAARALGLHDLPNSSPVHHRIVVTDVRYPNEAAWIVALGGRIVRVLRDAAPAIRSHDSESHTATLLAWHELDNGASKDWLYGQIDTLVQALEDAPTS